jgi:predicted dehydrogenase
MEKVKLGIIGMGRMGLTHYAILNSHPDVEIESIVDSSALMLSMLQKHMPVQTFKSYDEMLDRTNPDALLLCTPPSLNFEILKKTFKKKIPVFVEKPLTIQLWQASELTQLYSNNGIVNQVGYVNRFNDIFCEVKELLRENVIGAVIRFKSEMFSCTITKQDDGSGWRSSRESGGGATFEMASHAIDLVNFLLGKPDKVIGSSLSHIYSSKVEDAVYSTLLYKSGMAGTINVNWSDPSYRKPTNKIEIFGTLGRILVDQHSLRLFLNKENRQRNLRQGWNTFYITDLFKPVPFYVRGNEFTAQLYHFIDCVKKQNQETHCTFNDAEWVLEIIDNIFHDYEQNGRV